jgi:K+-sensing histidine kinase KdpD
VTRLTAAWRNPAVRGAAIGVAGAVALSAAMLPLRSHLSNAVMALALVIPVLAGGFIGGRFAGFASAIAAALCFDFFFTLPYLSLRMTNESDVAIAIALLLLATCGAEAGHRLRARDRSAREARAGFDRLHRVVDLSARGADVEDVVSATRAELMGLFGLDECVFERGEQRTSPVLGFDGAAYEYVGDRDAADLVLPPGGVALRVAGRGHTYGRLVMYASRPVHYSSLERTVAISIADELGITLATQPPGAR